MPFEEFYSKQEQSNQWAGQVQLPVRSFRKDCSGGFSRREFLASSSLSLIDAARAGKHTYIEKPVSITLDQASRDWINVTGYQDLVPVLFHRS